jgi:hypothetical protein
LDGIKAVAPARPMLTVAGEPEMALSGFNVPVDPSNAKT